MVNAHSQRRKPSSKLISGPDTFGQFRTVRLCTDMFHAIKVNSSEVFDWHNIWCWSGDVSQANPKANLLARPTSTAPKIRSNQMRFSCNLANQRSLENNQTTTMYQLPSTTMAVEA